MKNGGNNFGTLIGARVVPNSNHRSIRTALTALGCPPWFHCLSLAPSLVHYFSLAPTFIAFCPVSSAVQRVSA